MIDTTDFLTPAPRDLESALFGWDAEAATRRANAFVHAAIGRVTLAPRVAAAPSVPEIGSTYARLGGDTVIVRANDVAVTLAVQSRAA